MPQAEPKKKVVYLFGAGATHAEIANLLPSITDEEKVQRNLGLLVSHVSRRVIERVSHDRSYLKGLELVTGTFGSPNVELLISLIENSKIHHWDQKTRRLKRLVQEDIEAILTSSRRSRFYLHKALFEFHTHTLTKKKEELIGVISLNYDDVLDQAFELYCGEPNYCFSLESKVRVSNQIPLLKLHGSFNWRAQKIRGRNRTIEIIPLGANKSYLHAPYGFIWNRALEVLTECETLRVVGCSLSQNDAHLVDLLFKAHLERDPGKVFEIEIVDSDKSGRRIRQSYGFFPGILTLTQIDKNLIPDPDPPNPFKIWLERKSDRVLGGNLERTRYLKMLRR